MIPLLIGPGEIAALDRVRAHAEHNPFSLEAIRRSIAEGVPLAGSDPDYSCVLNGRFGVTFTIECHPGGVMRHLSMALRGDPGRTPSAAALGTIAALLGMAGDVNAPDAVLYLERGRGGAVNLVERVRRAGEPAHA